MSLILFRALPTLWGFAPRTPMKHSLYLFDCLLCGPDWLSGDRRSLLVIWMETVLVVLVNWVPFYPATPTGPIRAARFCLKPDSNRSDTRTLNPRSASNCEKTQSNFSTLLLLCHNEPTMGK